MKISIILEDFVQGFQAHVHLLSIATQEKKSKKEGKGGEKAEKKKELKVTKAILTCPKHGRMNSLVQIFELLIRLQYA